MPCAYGVQSINAVKGVDIKVQSYSNATYNAMYEEMTYVYT